MATQFAINEPDSFSSANQTYTPAENFVFNGLGLQSFEIILIPDDVLFGFDAIDFIGDHDYFDIPLPAHRSRPFLPWSYFGTVTVDVIANDGSPFDGVLTLYAGKSSTVVATGTSLGSGETFLQFDGGGTYSSYTLELQDNGNDQTGGYTIFVSVPNGRGPDVARYTPTTGNDTVTGNRGRDLLVGGGGNDTLIGREGHDVLIGGPGADTLQGGVTDPRSALSPDDNDLYVYVDATDTVIEQPGSGTDTIWTREVSFTLPANVENLLLVEGTAARDGIGNELDNVITGNSAHNGLVGNDGNDTLIGGGGADDMFGGFGNDTYSVDNAWASRSAAASIRCARACRPTCSPTASRRSSSTPARPGRSATQATTRSSATASATT
jgi:RTX calcium-binding nonapeptide repeat (4 copies)